MNNQQKIYFVNSHGYIKDEMIKIPEGTIFVSITGIGEIGKIPTCLSSHFFTEEKLLKAFGNIIERKKLEEELRTFLSQIYKKSYIDMRSIKINIYTGVAPEAVFELSNHTKFSDYGLMYFWPGGIYSMQENVTLYKDIITPAQGFPVEGLRWYDGLKSKDLRTLDNIFSGQQIMIIENLDPTRDSHFQFMKEIIDYVFIPSEITYFKDLLFQRLNNWKVSFKKWKETYVQEKLKDANRVIEFKKIIEKNLDDKEEYYTKKIDNNEDIDSSKTELNNIRNIRIQLLNKTDVDYVKNYILKFMSIMDFLEDQSYQQYVLVGGGFYYFSHLCMIKLSDIFKIQDYSNSIIIGLGCREALPILYPSDTNVSKIIQDKKYQDFLTFQEDSQRDDKIELSQVECNKVNCSGPINKLLFSNNTEKILDPNDFCKSLSCAYCNIATEKREGYNLLEANKCISCEAANAIVFYSSKDDSKLYCFTKQEIIKQIKKGKNVILEYSKDIKPKDLTEIKYDNLGILIPYEVVIGTLLFVKNVEQMPEYCWEFLVKRISHKEYQKKKKNESMSIIGDSDMKVDSDSDSDNDDMKVNIPIVIDDKFYENIINRCIIPFNYLSEDPKYPELIKFYTNNFGSFSPEHQEHFIKLLIDNVIPQNENVKIFIKKCKEYFLIYNPYTNMRIIYAIYKHLEQNYQNNYFDFFKIYLSLLENNQKIEFIELFSISLFSELKGNVTEFVKKCKEYFLSKNTTDNIIIANIIFNYLEKKQLDPLYLEKLRQEFFNLDKPM